MVQLIMEVIYTFITVITSYKIWSIFSHPNSKLWNRWPRIKIKWIQIFPSIRITVKGRVIHIHHWFHLSILLCISTFITGGILDSWITRGFLMGGIIQGLTNPSPTARKVFYHKKTDVES
jgi:hypothetical protein